MKNIKKIMITIGLLFLCSIFTRGIIIKADVITLPYKDDNGFKNINIIDLAKAINLDVKKENNKIEMIINNKKLSFDPEGSYVYLDDEILTLRSRPVIDIETNEIYKLPTLSKITKDGEGYLFPLEFIEKYLKIRGSNNGIIVNNNKVEIIEAVNAEKSDKNEAVKPGTDKEEAKEKEKVEDEEKTNNIVDAPEPPEAPDAVDPIIFD